MKLRIGVMICSLLFWAGTAARAADDKGQYLHWDYKVGGEERVRYEYKENFDFSDRGKDQNSQILNRFKVNFTAALSDEYLNKMADFFVEGMDIRDWTYRGKGVAGQSDPMDLHQAFVNIYNAGGSDFDVRLGRTELNYGERRLLASPTWLNNVRSWDGGVVHYHKGGLFSDLIYGQNVQYQDKGFNGSGGHEIIDGIYSGYQKNMVSPLVEWYFLHQEDTRALTYAKRFTAGMHTKFNIAPDTKLDVEVPYQWGRTGTVTGGTKEVKAYAFHADVTKGFNQFLWTPQVKVAYDEASGNKDPNGKHNNTFVPLYQSVHDPYGIFDFFRWQNVRNAELGATFSPTDRFRFTPQVDWFWLQSKYDSWYNSSGSALRTKTSGDRNYFVGTEASIKFQYDLTKNIKFETGYAHFFTGGYVQDTGANDDADWIYSQLVVKF